MMKKMKIYVTFIEADLLIIHSTRKIGKTDDLAFRSRQYVKIKFFTIPTAAIINEMCVDSETFMFLTNKQFVLNKCLDLTINKTAVSIKIRNINETTHDSSKYVVMNFYIFDTIKKIRMLAHFKTEVHLINNLKANILLKIDILTLEKMILNFEQNKMIIFTCKDFVTNIITVQKSENIVKSIRSFDKIVISIDVIMSMSMHIKRITISNDKDYNFFLKMQHTLGPKGGFFAHVIESKLIIVQIRNVFDKSFILSKNLKVEDLKNYVEKKCYMMRPKNRHLTIVSTFINIKKMTGLPINLFTNETVLFNGVIVYDDIVTRQRIISIVDAYPMIGNVKSEIINISFDQGMKINTISKTKSKSFRVFKLRKKNKAFVDKKFDLYQNIEKMNGITSTTFYVYSIFVVWTTTHLSNKSFTRKGRIVVNIRRLNKIFEFDVYLMSFQADIISCVQGCQYIFIMNCVTFFHQGSVAEENRHKFIVVIHRGFEQGNVAVMKYRNTAAYVQKKMNNLLKEYRDFCRMYIDDVMIFSHSLNEHLRHLRRIFALFIIMNIALKLMKTYLDYFTIALLGQKINSLKFITSQNKFKAIIDLFFSRFLKDLKTYLNMTKGLRSYISYYAQKADSLQRRKTTLLKNKFIQNVFKKKFSIRILMKTSSNDEINAYNRLQFDSSQFNGLTHFDRSKILYVDVNASKSGFGVMIYHIKNDFNSENTSSFKKQIDSIMFLNKVLTPTESKYGSTKLKMTDLIGTIKRIAHMIKSAVHFTVIYIDHDANPAITDQIKLSTTNIDKLNLKLMKTSIYLSQFRLIIRHRSKKSNIISNALNRLFIKLKTTSKLIGSIITVTGMTPNERTTVILFAKRG